MAETFGATASIIDILRLTEKLVAQGYEYIAGIRSSPDDLRQLLNELLAFNDVLFKLQYHMQNTSNPQTLNKVPGSNNDPISECMFELERLWFKMEPRKRPRGKMTCLIWPLKQKQTMDWISQLAFYRSLFLSNLAMKQSSLSKGIEGYSRDTGLSSLLGESSAHISHSRGLREGIQRINSSARTLQVDSRGQRTRIGKQAKFNIGRDENNILHWLCPRSFDVKHLEISGERLNDTGKWFMQTLEFDNWIKGRPGYLLLWGYGIPGSGKTYLSSLVIDHLKSIKAPSGNYGLAFIYFEYIEKGRQGLAQIMASLVKQLSAQAPSFPEETRKLYKLQRERRRPNFEELYNVFLATCRKFTRVFLVFDALDECGQEDEREHLLQLFQPLLEEKHQISVFLTSRPYSDIQKYLHHAPKIEITARQEDIEVYIQKKIGENARTKRLIERSKSTSKVMLKLAEFAKGSFLPVVFHMKYIFQQTTANQILAELNQPNPRAYRGLNALDPTYGNIMNIIYMKSKSYKELALTVLSWIAKAKRVLTVDELREAVSIELGANTLNPWDLPDQSILLDACAGLVTIDEKSKTVRLAHYTVQEYLLKHSIVPEDTDFRIAAACISYLLFDDFNRQNFLRTDGSGSHTFLGYACDNVFSHLKCSDHPSTAIYFLKLFMKVNHSIIPDCGFHLWPLNMPLGAAIDAGLYTVARQLLEMGCDRSPLANYNLHKAVIEGSIEIIKILFENGAESSAWDGNGMAPLHLAVVKGDIEIVRLFIQYGTDISIQDDEVGLTPLHMAVSRGYNEIVSLFLENGAQVSVPDNEGQTAIHLAVSGFRKNQETLNLVLKMCDRAEIWVQDQSGCTAFHLAAALGFDQVIQLFIDNEIDFSHPVRSNSGSTPLHKAALRGHKAFVQFLIRVGAIEDISIQDNRGRTALHLASRGGQYEHFPLSNIQKYQPNISYRDVILALLENGADISVQDYDGFTAVDEAVSRGNIDILGLFLEEGADLSLFKDCGTAALYLAASLGNKDIACLLIEKGVDIWKALDDNKQTALHGAVSGGHYDIVKLLLDTKACPDISLQDAAGQTALHIATLGGHYEIARLLRERDINIGLRTSAGYTAADIAVSTGHTEIARLILENEVHPPPRSAIFHDMSADTARQNNFIRRAGVWATGNIQASQRQKRYPDHGSQAGALQGETQGVLPDEKSKQQTDPSARGGNKRTRINETPARINNSKDIPKKPRTDTREIIEDSVRHHRNSPEGCSDTRVSSFRQSARARGPRHQGQGFQDPNRGSTTERRQKP